jgi:site-specific recombinase XerD
VNLQSAIDDWLSVVKENKSRNTYQTCLAASREFVRALGDLPVEQLDEEQYSIFLSRLKHHSASTEKLYATLIYLFYEHLAHINKHPVNIAAMRYLRRNQTRKPGKRLRDLDSDKLAEFKQFVFSFDAGNNLPLARAKAWITLAFESGLRAFEFCSLRLNNINLVKHYGIVIGKGDKEAKFYFTDQSVMAIRTYLQLRAAQEPGRGENVPLENRPIFVSHSKRGHSHLSPIDTDTARADLKHLVILAFGDDEHITPHILRHFFVNAILEATDNPETARKAARHDSIATTQRYLHVDEKEVQAAHQKVFGG